MCYRLVMTLYVGPGQPAIILGCSLIDFFFDLLYVGLELLYMGLEHVLACCVQTFAGSNQSCKGVIALHSNYDP